MNRKAIAILGAIFLLIVGTLGFLIYAKYFNKTDNTGITQAPPPIPPPDPPLPPESPSVVKLADEQVVSPTLFQDTTGVNYFDNHGNWFQADFNITGNQLSLTKKTQVSIPTKTNIEKILWPAAGKDFIAVLKDSSGKITYSYFNAESVTFTDLPGEIESLDWMPNGKQIMYVWVQKNKATLSLGSPDAKTYLDLADMWETDDAIFVSPNGDQVLYYETNKSGDISINSVTSDGKVWKSLVKTGENFGVLWSPDGQKFLFAKKDVMTQKPQLWVYSFSTGEVKNLGIFTTVEKTAWDKDNTVIYTSVPNNSTTSENSFTVDSFYRLDTSTLAKKQYPSPSISVDGRDLFLNSTSDKLFFKNAQDGGLYYLDLTK